jgi:hypothetical protein|tara:strand:- start:651 stop:878 length:228 start_codon:yes stop_codon:yes gene_type:complete
MTYQEAFDWIEANFEIRAEEAYDEFLNRIRNEFSNAGGLIDTLDNGVLLERTEFGKTVYYQQTLEQFFKELNPSL